jgi:hypothetical protein
MKNVCLLYFKTTINSSLVILLGFVGNLVANLEKPFDNSKIILLHHVIHVFINGNPN